MKHYACYVHGSWSEPSDNVIIVTSHTRRRHFSNCSLIVWRVLLFAFKVDCSHLVCRKESFKRWRTFFFSLVSTLGLFRKFISCLELIAKKQEYRPVGVKLLCFKLFSTVIIQLPCLGWGQFWPDCYLWVPTVTPQSNGIKINMNVLNYDFVFQDNQMSNIVMPLHWISMCNTILCRLCQV